MSQGLRVSGSISYTVKVSGSISYTHKVSGSIMPTYSTFTDLIKVSMLNSDFRFHA